MRTHDVRATARALGGAACSRDGIACPGSDHSQADRSPGVRLAPGSPDVFFIFSHAAIRFANAGISPCAARACALASTSCHAPPKINQHPFLDEEQPAKHMMFARSIWDMAKSAKGHPKLVAHRRFFVTAFFFRLSPCGYYTSTCATPYGSGYVASKSYYGSSGCYRRP